MTAVLIAGGILAAIAIVVAILRFVTWSFVTVVVSGVILIAFLTYHGMPWWAFVISGVIIAVGLIGTIFSIKSHWLFAAGVVFITIVTILVVSIATRSPSSTSSKTPEASAASSGSAAPSTTATTCDPKYVQSPFERGAQNRYLLDGVASLNLSATSPADQKRDAYLNAAGHDVVLLGGYAYASGLWADPNDTAPLLSGSCLSSKGQELHAMLVGAWTAKGSTAKNSATPTTGTNSGISGGKVVIASSPGMRSGRTGTLITFTNGSSIFIDDACGNVVFSGTPNIPKGPTDQPPTTTPSCQPGTTGTPPNCLATKVPSKDPAAQGNAPVGGGKNVDLGPGTYVPPSQMTQPPAAPYTPPPAPKATKPPVSSTPDPVTAPPRQTSAPAPTAPATGCAPPPGMTTC